MNDPFAYLYPYEFVLLTTFRKSGVAVPTAMWFAHEHNKLYMVTGRTAGKMKRIRNNGRVLLAPCDLMGHVLGPEIEAYAHELPPIQHAHADALLASKYGAEYDMDSSSDEQEEDQETFIEIIKDGQEPHDESHGLEKRLAQRKFLSSGLLSREQQRYGLRNSQTTGSSASGSSESMYKRHPNLYHCLPRRSRWDRPYACIAIAKGHITRALTRWLTIEQEFSGSFS